MPENDMVSVVVPCYNHAPFLAATVQSVLASAYSPLEVIIVNDGSTDPSEEVALELTHRYPNVHYAAQVNKGPAAARNHGIRLAAGTYILPLDADDLIAPRYIAEAVRLLSDEQVRVVYCEAEFFDQRQGPWKLPPFSRRLLARENMIFCSALFRKAEWQQCGGYDERMTWGWEDWEFWISMLKGGGEVRKIPEVGFYYRVRKHSRRKSTNREAKRKTIALINEKHQAFIREQLLGPLRFQRSHSRLINRLSSLFSLSRLQ